MQGKLVIDNKEYTMPKMSIDIYMEYLDLVEQIDQKARYTKQDIEVMLLFVCKVYGNQFTYEELKNPDTGLDVAGIILEFQMIDTVVAEEINKKVDKIKENFLKGK